MNNYLDGWERWCTEKFFREVDVVKTELTSQRFRRDDGSGARRGGGGSAVLWGPQGDGGEPLHIYQFITLLYKPAN